MLAIHFDPLRLISANPVWGQLDAKQTAAIRLFMSRWACFWRPRRWQRCSRRRLRAAGSDPMRALRH